jgi:prepilin-type N-terminal cleavage/methylation domain-containing protein
MKKPGKQQKPAGFTLPEMIIVVGIISLLLAILTPGLSTTKQFARETKTKGNARNYTHAIIWARDLKGDTAPEIATTATNAAVAMEYLRAKGYITQHGQ